MRKDEFEAGAVWAYRIGTRLGTPAARVELVAMPNRKGPTKVKIRHLDGDIAGLDEFASMAHLRCPWKDWRKVERDEAAELAFLERMEDEPKVDRVVCQAATAVLLSSGEDLLLDDYRDFTVIDSSQVPGLERAAARAGMTDRPWGSWPCFKNRKGDIYVPNRILLDVAMAFAQAEPETVNLYLDVEERELLEQGYAYGERYKHQWVLENKPVWALARSWALVDEGRDHLREELDRMRRLVGEAARALRDAGQDRIASRLERALQGR